VGAARGASTGGCSTGPAGCKAPGSIPSWTRLGVTRLAGVPAAGATKAPADSDTSVAASITRVLMNCGRPLPPIVGGP
jgi:hypothetical protein